MKNYIVLFFVLLFQTNFYGIERYTNGARLIVWASKLNLRDAPGLDAAVLYQISNGASVVTLNEKLDKSEDFLINPEVTDWQRVITGKWVKVAYNNYKGYLFDAYLSKYEMHDLKNWESFVEKESFTTPGSYEENERTIKKNGVIREVLNMNTEWTSEVYYIPDFSLEEAILFIKKDFIEPTRYEQDMNEIGTRNWTIDLTNKRIEMEGDDGINILEVKIQQVQNHCTLDLAITL